MNKNEIIELNNEKITQEMLEQIEESENVVNVENMGASGQYPGWEWFSVEMDDGETVDVFVKF